MKPYPCNPEEADEWISDYFLFVFVRNFVFFCKLAWWSWKRSISAPCLSAHTHTQHAKVNQCKTIHKRALLPVRLVMWLSAVDNFISLILLLTCFMRTDDCFLSQKWCYATQLLTRLSRHLSNLNGKTFPLANGNEFHFLKWPLNTNPPLFKQAT